MYLQDRASNISKTTIKWSKKYGAVEHLSTGIVNTFRVFLMSSKRVPYF